MHAWGSMHRGIHTGKYTWGCIETNKMEGQRHTKGLYMDIYKYTHRGTNTYTRKYMHGGTNTYVRKYMHEGKNIYRAIHEDKYAWGKHARGNMHLGTCMQRGIPAHGGQPYTWRQIHMETNTHGDKYTWRQIHMGAMRRTVSSSVLPMYINSEFIAHSIYQCI
jgi:hypothetical protein